MKLTGFPDFLKSDTIYQPNELKSVINMVRPNFTISRNDKKTKYFNVPCAFDIETSSFFRSTGKDKEKVSIMYEWTFGLYGAVIIGRTWEEFDTLMKELVSILNLCDERRLIIYVHNLSFEFQYIRKRFVWSKVFSLETRKPIYSLSNTGIEFRCSYLLSGYGLAKLGDQLKTYPVKKMVGDLDYSLIRHSKTPLALKELGYCSGDAKVVMAYIAEQIERNGDITKIPLTKTGFVRNYCRNKCFYEDGDNHKQSHKRQRFGEIMKSLVLSPDEYKQLKRAFQGGFTHANPFYSGKVVENVTSWDFTSSYPTVMIAEKFPMSTAEEIEISSEDELNKNLRLYCCLFDVEIFGLCSSLWFESPLSLSRCWSVVRPVVNNGRLVSAEHLKTTITETDFEVLKKFYTWDKIRISSFRRYKRDYLPTDFIKSILKLYHDKTTLKGVDGYEVEYLNSKEMINSCYGMCVTDIVRPDIVYEDEWEEPKEPDFDKAIKDYNNSRSRFLFYPWGVWVTSYARRNLFSGIYEFGNDYIYSDTDSIKVLNVENHDKYLRGYNKNIHDKLIKAMNFHGIPPEEIEPKTSEGISKCLGVWDFDGAYSKFKTLGAKRYMVEYAHDQRNKVKDYGKINITVSGLNKQICVPYLLDKYTPEKVFEAFTDQLHVPAEYTGKLTHTYIDEPRDGIVIDYLGNPGEYHELSGVHLENADYSMKLSREYVEYIMGIQNE